MPALTAAMATAILARDRRRALSARVMRLVNLFQPLFYYVCVDLGCGNVCVAQHELHRPQVRATLQQVRRKAVAKHVRRQRYAQTRAPAVRRKNFPHAYPAERFAPPVHKQRLTRDTLSQKFWPCILK